MKIGVLTFHRSINNGAVIQCYSLIAKLKERFPNDIVEVIDYHMPIVDEKLYNFTWHKYFSGSLKHKIRQLFYAKQFIKVQKAQQRKKEVFTSVISVLPLSSHRIYSNTTEELFRYIDENYDVVIAGSDAIWNYTLRGFPNPYFLDESISCKKLSYAASCFGMNYENIPQFQRKKIKKIFDSYTFIGVRDVESEKMAEFIGTKVPVFHTCDPTVFLKPDSLPVSKELLKQKMIQKGFDPTRKVIAIMGDQRMLKMIRSMFGIQYQIVSLFNFLEDADINLHDLTPYEWALSFSFFDITITTYFHGTLLSLRNGTPVVSLALENDFTRNHVAKVEDFLSRVGLEDCYFHTDYKTQNVDAIKNKITTLLNNKNSEDILDRMDKEAQSFELFARKIEN